MFFEFREREKERARGVELALLLLLLRSRKKEKKKNDGRMLSAIVTIITHFRALELLLGLGDLLGDLVAGAPGLLALCGRGGRGGVGGRGRHD